jgi:altronate hydrolase
VTAVLTISARDNVATAIEPIDAGRSLQIGAQTIAAIQPIPRGHKIALRPIRAGEAVVKYGSPIGTATADIAAGAHVHTHNVASARGRGDLAAAATSARIAEPDDDAANAPSGETP